MPSSVGWSGTASTTAAPLAIRWAPGNTPATGDYNVVGAGVLVRCVGGGNVNALPAPAIVGASKDGGTNTWRAIGTISQLELTNVDPTTTFLIDGFSDKDAGAKVLPSEPVIYSGNGSVDPSQIFVWTAASTAAWSVAAST